MFQPKPFALSISKMEPGLRFSIGRYVKKKKTNKKKINTPNYQCQYPVPVFTLYKGPRWSIPKSSHVSDSIKYKFSLLDTTTSFREIKFKIAEYIRNLRFTFLDDEQWTPPQIPSFYKKQETEWKKVRALYSRLFKLRDVLETLVLNWQIKKCIRNCKNTEDPVTMDLPKNPVRVIDFKNRLSFVYEAASLKRVIENRLLFSDYMFPEPKIPVNLLTNQPFTYGQLISIINQCKSYGYVSWIIQSFKESSVNLELFLFHNKQKLKVEAIKAYFKKPSYCLREVVIDYFNLEAEDCELPTQQISRFIEAYDTNPEMPIIQQWIAITRDLYISRELNESVLLKRLSARVDSSINTIYKVFLDTV